MHLALSVPVDGGKRWVRVPPCRGFGFPAWVRLLGRTELGTCKTGRELEEYANG